MSKLESDSRRVSETCSVRVRTTKTTYRVTAVMTLMSYVILYLRVHAARECQTFMFYFYFHALISVFTICQVHSYRFINM